MVTGKKISLALDVLEVTEELEIHLLCKQGVTYFDNVRLSPNLEESSSIFSEVIDPISCKLGYKTSSLVRVSC